MWVLSYCSSDSQIQAANFLRTVIASTILSRIRSKKKRTQHLYKQKGDHDILSSVSVGAADSCCCRNEEAQSKAAISTYHCSRLIMDLLFEHGKVFSRGAPYHCSRAVVGDGHQKQGWSLSLTVIGADIAAARSSQFLGIQSQRQEIITTCISVNGSILEGSTGSSNGSGSGKREHTANAQVLHALWLGFV